MKKVIRMVPIRDKSVKTPARDYVGKVHGAVTTDQPALNKIISA